MNPQNIVSTVIELLYLELQGLRGSLSEPGYKRHYLEICHAAFECVPKLTADALADLLSDWVAKNPAERGRLVDELTSKWREWQFAWKNPPSQSAKA